MTKKNYKKISECRLCGSKKISTVLPLSRSPLCDAYLKSKRKQQFYDLKLCMCNVCKFVQIDTIVNPKIIYRDYIYVTTSSLGLHDHFKNYTEDVCKALKFKNKKFIIDIGSNDGTLLSYFKRKKHKVLGVEPSYRSVIEAKKNGIESINEFFDFKIATKIINNHGFADFISINNLFANVEDLNAFTENLMKVLSPEGVIVIESSYLLNMINNMVFDFIYHEHLSYLSILPLEIFFKKFGLRLIRIKKVGTKGGSLRYFVARNKSKWKIDKSVNIYKNIEKKFNVSQNVFIKFNKKINIINKDLINYLLKNKNLDTVGYGASATTTTLISHFKLSKMFKYLVDENSGKINTYSPGFHIPVYSTKKLKIDKPKIIVILAWRYKKQIIQKLKKMNLGALAVIPIPKLKIIKL